MTPELLPGPTPSSAPPSLLQTLQKKVVVLSVAEITFDTSVYSQLPGQEAFLRAQVVAVWQAVARLARGLLTLSLQCCLGALPAWREDE